MVTKYDCKYAEIIYNQIPLKFNIISYLKSEANFDYSALNSVDQELKNPGFIKKKNRQKIEYEYYSQPIKLDLKQYSEYLIIKENNMYESSVITRNFSNNVFRFYKENLSENSEKNNFTFNYEFFQKINMENDQFYSKFYLKEELPIFNNHNIFLNVFKFLYFFYVRTKDYSIIEFCKKVKFNISFIILFLFVNFSMKNKKIEKYIFSDIILFLNEKSIDQEKRNLLSLVLIILSNIYSIYYIFESKINLVDEIFSFNFDDSVEFLYCFFGGEVPHSFFKEMNILKFIFSKKFFQEFFYRFSHKSYNLNQAMINCQNLIQKNNVFNINAKIYDLSFTKEKENLFLLSLNKCFEKINELYFEISLNKAAIIHSDTGIKISSILPKFENKYFVINFSRNNEDFFYTNILIPMKQREKFQFLIVYSSNYINDFLPFFIFNKKQKNNLDNKQIPPYFFNVLMPSAINKNRFAMKYYFDNSKVTFSLKSENKIFCENQFLLSEQFNKIRKTFHNTMYSQNLNFYFILKIIFETKKLVFDNKLDFYNSLNYIDNFMLNELLILRLKVKLNNSDGYSLLETLFNKISSINFSNINIKFIVIKINIFEECKLSVFINTNQNECILSIINKTINNKLNNYQIGVFYIMLDMIQSTIAPKKMSFVIPFDEDFEITEKITPICKSGQILSLNFLYNIKNVEFLRLLYMKYSIKFYELEITYLLLSDMEKLISTLDFCKIETLSIICTEGHINNLDKIEKALNNIFKSKVLKIITLKIFYQRNKFNIEEMKLFIIKICENLFENNKYIEIEIIKGTLDSFSIPLCSEYKKYYNNPILLLTDEIKINVHKENQAKRNAYIFKDIYMLIMIMMKNKTMMKIKKYSILKILSNFLANKVGLNIRFFKSEYIN